eukprot:scaffold82082_cov70-Cyclotella_meneghiniana.AAC.3
MAHQKLSRAQAKHVRLSSSFVLVTSSPSQHDPCAEINALMPEGQHHRVNCRIKSTLFQKPLPCSHLDIIGSPGSSVPNTQMSCQTIQIHLIVWPPIDSVAYLNVIWQQKYRNRPHWVHHIIHGYSFHAQAIESFSIQA